MAKKPAKKNSSHTSTKKHGKPHKASSSKKMKGC